MITMMTWRVVAVTTMTWRVVAAAADPRAGAVPERAGPAAVSASVVSSSVVPASASLVLSALGAVPVRAVPGPGAVRSAEMQDAPRELLQAASESHSGL